MKVIIYIYITQVAGVSIVLHRTNVLPQSRLHRILKKQLTKFCTSTIYIFIEQLHTLQELNCTKEKKNKSDVSTCPHRETHIGFLSRLMLFLVKLQEQSHSITRCCNINITKRLIYNRRLVMRRNINFLPYKTLTFYTIQYGKISSETQLQTCLWSYSEQKKVIG